MAKTTWGHVRAQWWHRLAYALQWVCAVAFYLVLISSESVRHVSDAIIIGPLLAAAVYWGVFGIYRLILWIIYGSIPAE